MRRATASSALANTVWAYAKAGLAADALFAAVAEAAVRDGLDDREQGGGLRRRPEGISEADGRCR